MSRKIIGVTVGTQLPKPNFKQTDPAKGDYIKNKPDFEGLKSRVTAAEEELAQKQPIGDYALKSEIPTDYLTEIPAEYITESELNAKGYLTEHQSLAAYAKTADLGNLATKDTVSKSDLASAVQTSLGKADTALQSYTETDPTVPSWAKASSKPCYTKTEVGLGNVDNVKQYSANNPPPYPVTSVNGATGAITVKTIPNCSVSDNGKFLRVVNGAATWSTIPYAEEAEF